MSHYDIDYFCEQCGTYVFSAMDDVDKPVLCSRCQKERDNKRTRIRIWIVTCEGTVVSVSTSEEAGKELMYLYLKACWAQNKKPDDFVITYKDLCCEDMKLVGSRLEKALDIDC